MKYINGELHEITNKEVFNQVKNEKDITSAFEIFINNDNDDDKYNWDKAHVILNTIKNQRKLVLDTFVKPINTRLCTIGKDKRFCHVDNTTLNKQVDLVIDYFENVFDEQEDQTFFEKHHSVGK
ncbi:hypothetical protein [Acidithiobacillus sp.]|jgi:hypothetical protein|uniref:hypothetical protein n=1 Tax=Acidithiobacillus sp. TaxID=1872118 RepID=UPI0035635A79